MNSVCGGEGVRLRTLFHNHPLGNKPRTIKFGFILSSVEQLMIKSTSCLCCLPCHYSRRNHVKLLVIFNQIQHEFSSLASCLLHQPLLRSISRIFMVNAKREKILQHSHFTYLECLHSQRGIMARKSYRTFRNTSNP